MEVKLKTHVTALLLLALAGGMAVAAGTKAPEGRSEGVVRGRVVTVTSRGALLSTARGDVWVSSAALSRTALRGDSLMVLGSSRGMFLSPLAIRLKPGSSPARSVRAGFRSLLERRVEDPASRGLAGGLLMGLRGTITPGTARAFRSSGTSHLLALSGMHTALAAAVFTLLSRLLFGRRGISWLLSMAGTVLFVMVSGARPSTVRAGIMCCCALLWMWRMGGRSHTLSFWLAAAGVSLVFVPGTICDRGAWLSYGAVLSLILLGKSFRGPGGFILTPLWAGVTVTVALAPLVNSMYGGVSWLGPAATVVSIPLMTAVMALGAAAAAGIPLASTGLSWTAGVWISILDALAHEPIHLAPEKLWPLWAAALLGLRVVSRWNGFHRRFR